MAAPSLQETVIRSKHGSMDAFEGNFVPAIQGGSYDRQSQPKRNVR